MRTALFWLLVLAALAWVAFAAQQGLATWPHLPMDGSNDAASRAALREAEMWHVARYAAGALLPAAVVVWIATRVR